MLVNNAGAMLIGALLDTDVDEGRKLFEVNVWGLLAVTQAFAPMLIKAQGSILNICSIAGAVRMAWQGVYNGSKAAATFFSETLRMEMDGLGVKVVTAMVGEVETQIYQGGSSYKLPKGSYYGDVKEFIVDQGNGKMQTSNETAENTAKSLVTDVLSGMSGQTWRGGVAGTAKVAHWLLPGRLFVSFPLSETERGDADRRDAGMDAAFESWDLQSQASYNNMNRVCMAYSLSHDDDEVGLRIHAHIHIT